MTLENTWVFPIVESVHVAGIGLLVGTLALPKRGRDWTRWTHWGLLVMLISGPLLFFANTGRYLHNPAFRLKMALAAAALVWQFALRRRGTLGRIGAVVLWSAVVVAGRAIADFDI